MAGSDVYQVGFATSCYKNDWEFLLKTNRLNRMIQLNDYNFAEKILYINNVKDRNKVKNHAEKLVQSGILTGYIFVQDYAREALAFFKIDKNSFNGGYYYAIQDLVAIYLCKTEYFLFYTTDSIMESRFNWIDPAVRIMKDNDSLKVANPLWNNRHGEAKRVSLREEKDFYIGFGFSDQCYLVKTAEFRAPIYGEKNDASERYPAYAGESFEKRVDAWMRNHNYYRLTYKNNSYLHQDFPKNILARKLALVLEDFPRNILTRKLAFVLGKF